MDITSVAVQVQAADGNMPAVLARPVGDGRYPAVVVVHEAFGPNAHIKDVAARLAREGYVTLAPDLYHRENKSVGSLHWGRMLRRWCTPAHRTGSSAIDVTPTGRTPPGTRGNDS